MSVRMIILSLAGLFVFSGCVPQIQRWYGDLEVADEESLILKHPSEGWEKELESGRYMIDWIPNRKDQSARILLFQDGSYEALGELTFSWRGRLPLGSLNLSAFEIGQDFDVRARIHQQNHNREVSTRRESCQKTGYCYSCVNLLGEYTCDFQLSDQCPGTRTIQSVRETWEEILEIRFFEPGTNSEIAQFTSDPLRQIDGNPRTERGPCL